VLVRDVGLRTLFILSGWFRQVVAARSQSLFKRALECSWHIHFQDITEFCTQCGALLSGRSCCSYFLQGSRQVVTARSQSPFSESIGMLLAQNFFAWRLQPFRAISWQHVRREQSEHGHLQDITEFCTQCRALLSGRSCCSYFRDGSRQVVAARSQTLFKRALECPWHSHLQDITEFCTQCRALLSGRSCCSYFRDGSRQVVAARSQTLFKRALECPWHSHLQDITEFCTQCRALLSGRSCCSYFRDGSRQVVAARSQPIAGHHRVLHTVFCIALGPLMLFILSAGFEASRDCTKPVTFFREHWHALGTELFRMASATVPCYQLAACAKGAE